MSDRQEIKPRSMNSSTLISCRREMLQTEENDRAIFCRSLGSIRSLNSVKARDRGHFSQLCNKPLHECSALSNQQHTKGKKHQLNKSHSRVIVCRTNRLKSRMIGRSVGRSIIEIWVRRLCFRLSVLLSSSQLIRFTSRRQINRQTDNQPTNPERNERNKKKRKRKKKKERTPRQSKALPAHQEVAMIIDLCSRPLPAWLLYLYMFMFVYKGLGEGD
ncbi:hypothetical protein BKA80DRAFT_113634 [Phyllosticta citrichinensis]